MYTEHDVFNTPESGAVIWRYMDFTKFVSVLDREALFFARAHTLGDPFEGTLTKADLAARSQLPEPFKSADGFVWFRRNLQRTAAISSWCLGEQESAAMWRLYLTSGEGVALRSTVGGLCAAFHAHEEPVYVGSVKYIDYDQTPIPESNLFWTFVHKRKSFEHEREVRAVIMPEMVDPHASFERVVEVPDGGQYVGVDLRQLVRAVHVAPTAGPWLEHLVRSVVARYGFAFPVERSALGEDPVF